MLDKAEAKAVAAVQANPVQPGRNNQEALDLYFRLTGFRETNINAVYHHMLDQYGPPCANCGKPLRTHKARWCPACGAGVLAPNSSDNSEGTEA